MDLQSEKCKELLLQTCAKIARIDINILKSQLEEIDWKKMMHKQKLYRTIWLIFLLFEVSVFFGVFIINIVKKSSEISLTTFTTITGGLFFAGIMYSVARNKYDVFKLLREVLS